MSSRHCLRASGEAAASGGLRSNSLAAASAPPLAACEGALDGRPDSCRRAARAAANGGCSTGTVAPGAGTREACGVEDATPSVISTSSTRTMGTKRMMKCDQLASPTWRAKCRGVANHGRVAEGTRPSPEGVYSGGS